MKPQKLTILCQRFYPELISTGLTLTELCEVLARKGVEVEVVCGPPTILGGKYSKFTNYMEIKIHRVWGTQFPKMNLFGRIINQITYSVSTLLFLLKSSKKDPILVLTNPPFLAISAAIMRILKRRPYLYLIFDVYPDTAVVLGLLGKNSSLTWLWHLTNKITFIFAKKIIVLGRCMQAVIEPRLTKKQKEKIEIITVWSNDRLIQESKTEYKNNVFIHEWGLQDKFVVLYSGNMGWFHDLETIIEAAKILKSHTEIEFVFVGEGHKKEYIRNYIEEYRLRNCQLHTYVDRDCLGLLLAAGDVGLVSLNEGQEGLSVPSKTFGLMAAGLPIFGIMSERSEIAQIIKENDFGEVIRPGDAVSLASLVLALSKDSDQAKVWGDNAKKAIEDKYNLNIIADKYLDLIKNINQ